MRNVLIAVAAIAVAFIAGRYSKPAETKTVYVRDTQTETHKDVKRRTVKETKPDGTTVVTIDTEASTKTREVEKVATKSETKNMPDWSLGVYTNAVYTNPNTPHAYLVTLDRRVLSSLYVGVYVQTDLKEVEYGLGVRINF